MTDSPSPLHQQAIMAALSAKWDEAVKLNQLIIEEEPTSVDALNRIARAHFELGDLNKSKKFYQKALGLDPYNQIAYKFLKRIEAVSKKGVKINGNHHTPASTLPITSDLFIEEPGRTKLVTLLKVAEPQKLSMLVSGEGAKLVAKNRAVVVTDQNDKYLGVLPDDISRRLIRLMRGGNKYQAIIKTIKLNSLSVLLREIFRSARFKNEPSFLDSFSGSFTYSSDHIIVPQDGEEGSADAEEEVLE